MVITLRRPSKMMDNLRAQQHRLHISKSQLALMQCKHRHHGRCGLVLSKRVVVRPEKQSTARVLQIRHKSSAKLPEMSGAAGAKHERSVCLKLLGLDKGANVSDSAIEEVLPA